MLHFVGVGPGDPELITMMTVHILKEADVIARTAHDFAGATG